MTFSLKIKCKNIFFFAYLGGVGFLPLQVCPSPVYPALQLQEYEPTVFTQTAFTSQLWVLVLHSSRSAKITLINGRDIKQMILK